MNFFDKRESGRVRKPLYMALYSGPGVGKSSAAATFPKPHFFDFEESTHTLDVSRSRPLEWDEIMSDLNEILERDELPEIETIVFDTIDELERLIHHKIADKAKKDNIGDIGWQRGYSLAVDYWAELISITRQIRDKHKTHTVFLAHASSRTATDFEKEKDFARYKMAIHPKACDYIFGQVEMVLFAKKDIAFKTVDDKTFAKDLDNRILCTSLSAYFDAKNRIGLPATLPMPKKNMFQVLWSAYNAAFDATPDKTYKEIIDLIPGIKDEALRKSMTDYTNINKDNSEILIAIKQKILAKKQEQ